MSKSGVWKKIINDYLILVGILILIVYTCVVQPTFLSTSNILSLMRSFVPLAFVALGMTLIIIGGYIDLSVAGLFSLLSILGCIFCNRFGAVSLPMTMLVGCLCGMLNALVLVRCGARDDSDALFITFGMQTVFAALALIANGGLAVTLTQTDFTRFIGSGNLFGIPVVLLLFAAATAVLHFVMKKNSGWAIDLFGGRQSGSGRTVRHKGKQDHFHHLYSHRHCYGARSVYSALPRRHINTDRRQGIRDQRNYGCHDWRHKSCRR